MNPVTRRTTLAVAMAVGVLLLAGVAGAAVRAGSPGSILIGGVGPLSQPGDVAAGIDMRWAMQTAVGDLNRKGGVLGRKLALDFEDTANKPDVAAAIAKKLVEEKHVGAVVGEYHSGAALAAIPEYEKAGVPTIFSETWADPITGGDPKNGLPKDPPNVFRIAPSSSYANSVLTSWLKKLKTKQVIELYEATDFGKSQRDTLKAQLEGTAIKLAQIQVQLNQPDYSSILTRAQSEYPDASVVIFDITGDSSYVMEENAVSVGLIHKGTIGVANQVARDSSAYWRGVPDGVGFVFEYTGPVPSQYNKLTKSLATRYQRKFHQQPANWVFEAYDSVLLVANAMKRARTTDGAKVVEALETTHMAGAQGKYVFPYRSGHPVPKSKPSWWWHQWPNPPIQIVEYTAKGQTIAKAPVIWPPARKSRSVRGRTYIEPAGA